MWLKASQKAFSWYFVISQNIHVTIHFCKCCNILFSISDYESLRIGGLVFAVVLFLMGIALIVSKCLTTLSTRQMCNAECQRHHTVIPVCVSWPHTLPNSYAAAKQAGFCPSQTSGSGAHWCFLHNLDAQHSHGPCIAAICPLYLIPFLTHSVLPRFLLLPASTCCYCQW